MAIFSVEVRYFPATAVFGRTVYVISQTGIAYFHAVCPICEGAKKITYKGYEIKCTYCNNEAVPSHTVRGYNVDKYIVNEIHIKGPDRKNAYTPSAQLDYRNLPWIAEVAAFCGKRKKSFLLSDTFIDPDRDTILGALNVSNYIFTSRALANKAIEFLLEREKEQLAEFNAKYGCDYKYPERRN